jgi:exopolysaccharide biosynthesis predicted pyruvyltransferase EpsI
VIMPSASEEGAPTLRSQSRLPPAGTDTLLVSTRDGNAGDRLIADACERYLMERGLNVWRSDGSIEEAAAANDTAYLGDLFSSFRGIVAFAGGGNVGIYPDNEQIRSMVVRHLGRQHRCLVFPQSVVKPEAALLDPRVTVWCRDAISHSILRNAGAKTALVPDVALYMDDKIPKRPGGKQLFFIRRNPDADAESIDNAIDVDCNCVDLTLHQPLAQIIATLEPYETVLSNRLHGALIALMMRKKVVLLPVNYHKSISFYETWLADDPGIAFVRSSRELPPALARLKSPRTNLSALFCEHADPAFSRFLLEA